MFSVGDMYKSIKEFAQRVKHAGQGYYLAKVDVQSAFDTIPQEAVLHLMQELPSHRRYKLLRHVELQASHKGQAATAGTGPAMIRRWRSSATGVDDLSSFLQKIEEQLAPNRNNTVFAANVFEKVLDTRSLLALMASHVRGNLVKIGKKYYRQKEGIPQGSVLSSMLCNYFYADLEITHFGFLRTDDHDCLLLRLIDDFLLITTDRSKAAKFVNLMHGGLPAYGVRVNPGKSLVNFDLVAADGTPVPRLQSGDRFPYCGTLLDCRTLEIAKNREAHATGHAVFDSLTVEFSRAPGGSFKKRVLNAFKANSHMMFFDTCHNTSETTSRNMYEAFSATATKMWAYARCLPRRKKPSSGLVIGERTAPLRHGLHTQPPPRRAYRRHVLVPRYHPGPHTYLLPPAGEQVEKVEISGVPIFGGQVARVLVGWLFIPPTPLAKLAKQRQRCSDLTRHLAPQACPCRLSPRACEEANRVHGGVGLVAARNAATRRQQELQGTGRSFYLNTQFGWFRVNSVTDRQGSPESPVIARRCVEMSVSLCENRRCSLLLSIPYTCIPGVNRPICLPTYLAR